MFLCFYLFIADFSLKILMQLKNDSDVEVISRPLRQGKESVQAFHAGPCLKGESNSQ